MSAQRLRDAAKVLRERAEAAGDAVGHTTWTRDGIQGRGDGLCWDVGNGEGRAVACTDFEEVHDFVAAMNLDVGLALADWLDTAGADLWAHGPLCECGSGCLDCDDSLWQPHVRRALAVADLILGGAA